MVSVKPGTSLAKQDWSTRLGFDRDSGVEADEERSDATYGEDPYSPSRCQR